MRRRKAVKHERKDERRNMISKAITAPLEDTFSTNHIVTDQLQM